MASLFVTAADAEGLQRCREAVANASAGTCRDVSNPLVDAMAHFAAGRYPNASRILASVSPRERVRVGGSNVERELIELVEQAARASLTH